MNKYLTELKYKLRIFMQGRYGADELSRAISYFSLGVLVLALFIPVLRLLYYPVLILIGWSLYRSLSRNTAKRQKERAFYLTLSQRASQKWKLLKNMWKYRKTHRYFTCPGCRVAVRVAKPEKHGTMTVTCPQCRTAFRKRV